MPGGPAPPVWFLACLGLVLVLGMFAPGGPVVRGVWRLVGLLPVAAGVALHWSAWRALEDADTPTDSTARARRLVTDGAFSRTRNPMYLAGILILIGVAILTGSEAALVPVGVFWWAARRFVLWEEGVLEARFGAEYRTYRKRVRRWV